MPRVPNPQHIDPITQASIERTPSVIVFSDPRSAGNADHLRGLTREVRSGTYHPRLDDVAERVMAWLTPAPGIAAS